MNIANKSPRDHCRGGRPRRRRETVCADVVGVCQDNVMASSSPDVALVRYVSPLRGSCQADGTGPVAFDSLAGCQVNDRSPVPQQVARSLTGRLIPSRWPGATKLFIMSPGDSRRASRQGHSTRRTFDKMDTRQGQSARVQPDGSA